LSNQENIYNKILEYYTYADLLIRVVENSSSKLAQEQFSIAEEVASRLEDCADQIASQYIEFVKNGESSQGIEKIRTSLNSIAQKIEECRNKILILHQE
jgi:hypothetical protein